MSPRRPRIRILLAGLVAAVLSPRAGLAGDDGVGVAPIAGNVDVALAPLRVAPPEPPRAGGSLTAAARPAPFAPGGLALPIAETLTVNLVMLEWSRWIGAASWAQVTPGSVDRNLRSGWVLDDDAFWINQLGHPYQGTWSHTAARSSGLGFWASVPFTVGGSALWEIAGETTLPSVNDQITTTVAGVVLGEVLYRFAGALRAEGGPWNEAAAAVLAPMAAINRELVGPPPPLPAPPSRWRLDLGGAAFSGPGPSGGRAPLGYGGLSFTYGLPWNPGLRIERPFDHFVLDLGWTASTDPAATLRARGLVAGGTFGGDLARGVYGAFLSFDLDTPPGHRVSTSAIGFGGSGGAHLGRGLALEWDAIASAVLLGAGGAVPPGPDAPARGYEFGPGEQALLAARVLAGSRATAGIALRQYFLLGADGDRGTELLLQGSAGGTVRLVGPHGVGFEVSRFLRRAGTSGAAFRQADSAVRVYYVLHGGA